MASNALTRLYRVLVQDPNGDPVIQRRILAVGSASNDGEMLATLASLPHVAEDVDAAIGKRKGARERAAWISRKERTPDEVKAALKGERRVAVLTAAAKRTDLDKTAYKTIADFAHPKSNTALLKNPAVSLELKKSVAVVWGSQNEDENGYRLREDLASSFGPIPAAHDALASNTTHPDILYFVSRSKLSEASQMRVVEHLIKPNIQHAIKSNDYYVAERLKAAAQAAMNLSANPGTTPVVREVLLQTFVNVGPIPKPTKSYYASFDMEKLRLETIEAIKSGSTGAFVDPAEEAATTTDSERLLELAKAANKDDNNTLAQAVLANQLVSAEVIREVARFVGWQARASVMEMLVTREDPSAFVEMVNHSYGFVEDDILAKAPNPPEVLRLMALSLNEQTGGQRAQGAWLQILQSRWCTSTVLLELPVMAIGHPEAPANVATVVNAALLEAFGDDVAKWNLFEALVKDGNLPLRESIEAVNALTP